MIVFQWYATNQPLIYAIASTAIVIIDWFMARKPNCKADGVLHLIEIQIRNLLNLPPLQQDYYPPTPSQPAPPIAASQDTQKS